MKDDAPAGGEPVPAERRAGRRHRVEIPVTLHGGRLEVKGRAVNLSRHGVAVELTDPGWFDGADPRDPTGSAAALQRAFVGGVVVQFRAPQEVRVPAKLIRLGGPTPERALPMLGLRLARKLADDEWTRLDIPPQEASTVRLRPVRRGTHLELSLLDPELGLVARVAATAGLPTLVDGTFLGPAVDPLVLRARCGADPRPARLYTGPHVLWVGSATMVEFYGGRTHSTARFQLNPPLPAPALTRFETLPRGLRP